LQKLLSHWQMFVRTHFYFIRVMNEPQN